MLPAKLAISFRNIFTFFDKLKETLEFLAIGCHVKGPLPPPLRIQDITKSCMRQVRTEGAMTWQVLFFLPRVAGFPRPKSE